MDELIANKIESFFAKYPVRHFDKSYILANAGEGLPGIIHLLDGQVRQYDISAQGNEVVVNVFKPPAFFPVSWAMTRIPNRYFFDTASPVTAHVVPPEDVIQFLKNNPDVTFDLLSRVYSGLEGLQRRMAHLMGGTARTRVLYELIIEVKRFGALQPNGSYKIDIHEDELARRAGLTRETVNREFTELRRAGFVATERRQLTVRDLAALERELGEDL